VRWGRELEAVSGQLSASLTQAGRSSSPPRRDHQEYPLAFYLLYAIISLKNDGDAIAGEFSMLELDRIIEGDCLTVLKSLPDSCVDLIFTSPPYADNRKKTYKGVPIKDYVDWFLPISAELRRVLRYESSCVPGME